MALPGLAREGIGALGNSALLIVGHIPECMITTWMSMNFRRAGVAAYSGDTEIDQLALSLLQNLLFCTGTSGMPRFWISLFDGEVV